MNKNPLTRYLTLFFFMVSIFTGVSGQNETMISDSIYSGILKEERSIKVILPDTYKPGSPEKYDVIYLTDGEWALDLFPFIYKFAKGENYVPPAIFVDIPNTYISKVNQRDRDFLPVHVDDPSISGGADKFIAFLKDELVPYINKKYPTDGNNSLYGHSYGGMFVIYTLLKEPGLFQTYYATDPSVWWNDSYVIKLASEKLGSLPAGKLLWIAGITETYKYMGIDRMDSVLKLKATPGLKWKMTTFPNEKHNSVRLKAIYDGIKFAYSGYSATLQFHPMNGILLKDKPATIFLLNNYPEIRYTTDGTEPSGTSPAVDSKIILNGPAELVLKSFSASGRYDQVAKGSFVTGETLASSAKPKKIINGGLKYSCYAGNWEKIPDFKSLKPLQSGIADSLVSFNNMPVKSDFAILFDGWIEIDENGYYIFATSTKNASRLFIGKKLIIDENTLHQSETIKSYMLPLEKGFYPVRLEYFQKEADPDLKFIYLKPGATDPSPVPLKMMYH